MRRVVPCLLALTLTLGGAQAAHLVREQVSKSVYVVRPVAGDNVAVSNAAFVVLKDRVLVFDTLSNSELMAEMLGLIGEVAKLPIGMIVLSHWHKDHVGGMDLMAARPHQLMAAPGTVDRINQSRASDLTFLAKHERDLVSLMSNAVDSTESEQLAVKLRDVRQELGRIRRLPPLRANMEISDESEISFGDKVILIQYRGPGHTVGDLMIYVVDEQVLLAGDLLTVDTLPNLGDAYTAEWLDRLETISWLNVKKIVPGHGPVGTKEDVQALQGYLQDLRRLVLPISKEGTMADLVEQLRLPGAYSGWASEDLWFPATLRVFHELKGMLPPP